MRRFIMTLICVLVVFFTVLTFKAQCAIVVELVSPPDQATGIGLPVVLEITVNDPYMAYEITIDDNADFSSPEAVLYEEGYFNGNVIDTAYGLVDGTTYYWYARANTFSQSWLTTFMTWEFTTEGCYIDTPVMMFPDSGAAALTQPVYLEWEEVADALEYEVQVDDNDDFSSPVYDFNLPGIGSCVFDLDGGVPYYWRVKAIKEQCASDWSPVREFTPDYEAGIADETRNGLPSDFELYQNYPNPFNPRTTLTFSLPRGQDVTIEIYNILGEKIETLLTGKYPAGTWTVEWDGGEYSSGIYYYRIKAGDFVDSKKMILLK